jgi:hypothetical protein
VTPRHLNTLPSAHTSDRESARTRPQLGFCPTGPDDEAISGAPRSAAIIRIPIDSTRGGFSAEFLNQTSESVRGVRMRQRDLVKRVEIRFFHGRRSRNRAHVPGEIADTVRRGDCAIPGVLESEEGGVIHHF